MRFNCICQTVPSKWNLIVFIVLVNICLVFSAKANSISQKIVEIEQKLGAQVGVSVYEVKNKKLWSHKGDTRFPLTSTFKTLACAKLLADIDNGTQTFDTSVVINKNSLITWSPITKKLVGENFTLEQACSATMLMSDNTAANIVLEAINGPKGVTAFMRSIGDDITRLDRVEPELNEALKGDERDTTTPNAMVKSLNTILFGSVLSQTAKVQLKQWMIDNKVTASLLRAVLPEGWKIADRSGAGGFGSRAITAVVWSDDRTPIIISIYLTQTSASFTERNKAIADIGEEIFKVYSE